MINLLISLVIITMEAVKILSLLMVKSLINCYENMNIYILRVLFTGLSYWFLNFRIDILAKK